MQQAKLSALLPAALIFLSSCFHKDTKTGTADDIQYSFVCHTDKGDYLITHESLFQATSKSSGPKGTFTSGYEDFRYTVRDLHTGAQVTRLVLGDRDDEILPLGFDGQRLWCYGADKKTGLHARDPISLEIIVTQEKIEAANPALSGKINMPKINEADQSFMFDPQSRKIMITDQQGNLFMLDPASLKATTVQKKPAYYNSSPDAVSTSAYRINGGYINLSGDPRRNIEFGKDLKTEESYLSGSVLLERNDDRLADITQSLISNNKKYFYSIQREHDSLLQLYPVLKDERNAYLSIKDYHLVDRYQKLDSKIKDAKEDEEYATADILRHLGNTVLSIDTNTIYVLHANNLSDTSSILISKVKIENDKAVLLWTTIVPQIYFNPSKAIPHGGMAGVFKKGNPDFDYERYAIEGNVLAGVKMLFAFGIDTETGKLLWKEQL